LRRSRNLMYRTGNGFCRAEELPDPEYGIHGLAIINEPEIWIVNLLSKTAQHYVDPASTFNRRMRMFQERAASPTTPRTDQVPRIHSRHVHDPLVS
jgi:hypothetical protein